ncbi:hypothetical protein ACFQ07_28060, partial [Actinomadura adrarensis]
MTVATLEGLSASLKPIALSNVATQFQKILGAQSVLKDMAGLSELSRLASSAFRVVEQERFVGGLAASQAFTKAFG